MNVFVERKCPICDSGKATEFINPDLHPKENLERQKIVGEAFISRKSFFLIPDVNAAFYTVRSISPPNHLNKLYSNMSDNVYSGDSETDYMTKDMYVERIVDALACKTDVSILEIGADNGTIIKKLKKFTNISHYTAIEPNEKMHQKLSKVSNNVYSDLSELPEGETFDLVIGIHVFDHIPEISEYIEKLVKRIKKDGLIFGVVHDESSILAKLLTNRWPAYCLQHPHLFNPETIEKILNNRDLNQIEIYKTVNSFKLGYLLSQFF